MPLNQSENLVKLGHPGSRSAPFKGVSSNSYEMHAGEEEQAFAGSERGSFYWNSRKACGS